MNLFAQVFQDLEDGLYAPFPEEEQFLRDETDTSVNEQEAYVLA